MKTHLFDNFFIRVKHEYLNTYFLYFFINNINTDNLSRCVIDYAYFVIKITDENRIIQPIILNDSVENDTRS